MARVWLVVVALVAAACTGGGDVDAAAGTGEGTATPAPPPAAGAGDATAGATPAPEASPPTAGSLPDAAGIGDELYPALGNRGYDVQHYDLDLSLDPDAPSLDGTVTIDAVATAELDRFYLDLEGFALGDVTVDGASAEVSRVAEELEITPPSPLTAGEPFTVAVSYAGAVDPVPSLSGVGAVGWRRNAEGINYVAAEPDGAHAWFPSNDHPLDKATFRTTVTVPEPLVAASNGELIETTSADGATTYVWEMDEPMAPYLATVVAGDVEIVVDEDASETAGVTVRHVLPADEVDDPPTNLDRTGEMIAFLEEFFGPFPFDRYGIAVVDGFPAALETQTLTVFGRPPGSGRLPARIMVHEIAHEWFGNSVSLEQWEDLWLKEGAATYAEWLWAAAESDDPDARLQLEAEQNADFLGSASGVPATGEPDGDLLYTPAPYVGGGLVFHALRAEVGDEAFFETLRTFTDRFEDGNASGDDFIAVAEEVAGRQLDDLFDAWLLQRDRPPVPDAGG